MAVEVDPVTVTTTAEAVEVVVNGPSPMRPTLLGTSAVRALRAGAAVGAGAAARFFFAGPVGVATCVAVLRATVVQLSDVMVAVTRVVVLLRYWTVYVVVE